MHRLGSRNPSTNLAIIFGISKKYKESFGVFQNTWYIINANHLNHKSILSSFFLVSSESILYQWTNIILTIVVFNLYIMYSYKCKLKSNRSAKYEGADGRCLFLIYVLLRGWESLTSTGWDIIPLQVNSRPKTNALGWSETL